MVEAVSIQIEVPILATSIVRLEQTELIPILADLQELQDLLTLRLGVDLDLVL